MLQTTSHAEALAGADSAALLKSLLAGTSDAAVEAAGEEMDRAGDVGLTVGFDELKLLAGAEGLRGRPGAASELYIVTAAIDASLTDFEHRTAYFSGIEANDFLPLGDGGLLVGCFANPRWFVDIHMLVMRSVADQRQLGQKVQAAREQAQLDRLLQAADGTAIFDAELVAQVVNGVDIFLAALTALLRAHGDTRIAMVHDFYLKHQAFGRGRHPREGRKRFQGVELAYEIQLTRLAPEAA